MDDYTMPKETGSDRPAESFEKPISESPALEVPSSDRPAEVPSPEPDQAPAEEVPSQDPVPVEASSPKEESKQGLPPRIPSARNS